MEHSASVEPSSSVYNWNRNLPQEVCALRKQVQGMETEHVRLRLCLNCLSDTVKLLVCSQSRKAQNYLPEEIHRGTLKTPSPHFWNSNNDQQSAASNRDRDREQYRKGYGCSSRPHSARLPVRKSEDLLVRRQSATDSSDLTASIYIP
jgi:hypothetical protein